MLKTLTAGVLSIALLTSCGSGVVESEPDFFEPELSASFTGVFALTNSVSDLRLSATSAPRVYAYSLLAGDIAFSNSTDPTYSQADAATAIEYVSSELFKNNRASEAMRAYRLRFTKEPTENGLEVGKNIIRLSNMDGFNELPLSANDYQNTGSSTESMEKYQLDPLWQWEPTGLIKSPAFEPYWGSLKTIITESEDCVTDPPDLSVLEAEAKNLLEQTQDLTPTEETELFLAGDGTPTPSGQWLRAVASAAKENNVSDSDMSALLAKAAIASYDVSIVVWRDKFFYNIARPETMWNRLYDQDIVLTRETPPHPSYPSGHSGFSGAAANILWFYLGDVPVTFSLPEDMIAEEEVFTYATPLEAVDAANQSRVDPFFHYPLDTQAGAKVGLCVAKTVNDNYPNYFLKN